MARRHGVETEKCGRKQEAGEGSLSNGKKEKWQLCVPSFNSNSDGLSGSIPLSDSMGDKSLGVRPFKNKGHTSRAEPLS